MPHILAVKITRVRTDEATVYVQVNETTSGEQSRDEATDAAKEWAKNLSLAKADALFADLRTEYEGYRSNARVIDAGSHVDVIA